MDANPRLFSPDAESSVRPPALVYESDITLRDLFAMQAMSGLIDALDVGEEYDEPVLARDAYRMADAMLEARK